MKKKCKWFTVLLLCCLFSMGNAQEKDWQKLLQQNKYEEVIAQSDSLSAADSTNYQTMNMVGKAYEGMLLYRKAYDCFQHCFTLDSTNQELLSTLARTATNLGRAKEAEQYYQRILVMDSLNFHANFQLARLYMQLGNYEDALALYGKLGEQHDDHPAIYQAIGNCYARMEKDVEASIAYFRAYDKNRENAGLANALVATLYRMSANYSGHVMEGVAICDTALKYNPDNLALLRNKGMGLYIAKEYAGADSVYSDLLARGDSSYMTLKYAGASKFYAEFYLPAVPLLEKAYALDTTSVEVSLLLGAALGKTYDRKQAFELLDHAEHLLQPDPGLMQSIMGYRADVYKRDGQISKSVKLYYELWKEHPKRLDYLRHILMMQGIFKKDMKPEAYQRGLFILVLYTQECLKTEMEAKALTLSFSKVFLKRYYEDLFFRNQTEATMLAPDGKKSTISIVDLRGLLQQLPDE